MHVVWVSNPGGASIIYDPRESVNVGQSLGRTQRLKTRKLNAGLSNLTTRSTGETKNTPDNALLGE